MTAKELIKVLQDLGEENLDMKVLIYEEYRYVHIEDVEIIDKPEEYDFSNVKFIGIN